MSSYYEKEKLKKKSRTTVYLRIVAPLQVPEAVPSCSLPMWLEFGAIRLTRHILILLFWLVCFVMIVSCSDCIGEILEDKTQF